MSSFSTFLSKYIVHQDSDYYSHQSMIDKVKYNFEQDDLDEMMELYCKVVYDTPDMPVSVMERSSDYTTLRGDFDMKIKKTDMERLKLSMDAPFYSMDEVKAVMNMFYEVIFTVVKNPKPYQLYCFLMEKKTPVESGEFVKSGFHVEFPFILLSKADQSVVVFPKLEKDYELLDIFARFGEEYQKTFFDSNLINHSWLLYGSRKEVGAQTYRMSGIYDKYLKQVSLEDVLKERTLYNCNQEAIVLNEEASYYLPRIMSITHHGKKDYICRTIPMELTSAKSTFKKLKPLDKSMPDRPVASTPEECLKEVREIMPFLSAERASTYESWMRVGWALHNIGVGSQDALQIWIDFSKKTTKGNFSEAGCIYEWAKMDRKNDGPKVTLGTLRFYAKEDDEEEYVKYCRAKSKSVVLNSIEKNGTLTPYAAAQAMYHQYKNDFVYTESKMWFYYDNHRWNPSPEGLELRKRICDLIVPIQERIDRLRREIREIDEKIRDQEENVGDVEEDEKVSEKDKQNKDKLRQLLIKEKNRLEDTTTKDKIIKECRELFLDKKFEEKTDSNVYLMGFNNGILDLTQGVFRDGRPDDFVTFCTGYDFKEFTDDAHEMKMVEEYLLKVFPDPEIRNYFLNQACLILRGGNILKKVMVWTGHGDNSKSVTIELLQNILGQYAIELPTALLTQQRAQSSAASPELVRTKGRRFAMIQEPDVNDTINTGILKQLSGNDVLSCRGLFQSQIEFRPQLKLAIICNKLPKVPSDDQATWNRLRVIPFEAKFIDPKECAPTFQEQFIRKQFPMDPLFSEKLPKMKEAFMYMLFKRYLHGEKYGFSSTEPEKVICATKVYRAANDLYMNFLSEKLVEDTDSMGIMLADLYENFRMWFKNNYNSKYIPPKLEMVEYLKTRYKRHFVINRLIGFRYRTEEDDEAEANAEFDRMQQEKEQIAQMRKEYEEKMSQ